MTDTYEGKGSCLCGAITITAKEMSHSVGACHCKMCRKWGGGPFVEVNCGSEITFSGEENLSIYNSSDWADRGFCKNCGTHLFYKLKEGNQHMVPVGLFDDDSGLKFETASPRGAVFSWLTPPPGPGPTALAQRA